jgi:nitroreductase/ferredoxin
MRPKGETVSYLEVDRERCTRDGLCALECPITLIEQDAEGFPVAAAHMESACILCGHCVAVCPKGCLCIGGISQKELRPAAKAPAATPKALQEWMISRRSVRSFADRPVPRELVASCLEVARFAPTALNGQPMEWIVLEQAGDVRALAECCAEYMRAAGLYPNFLRPFDASRETILRGAPVLVAVHADASAPIPPATDCVIALTHFELAAHALGLGTCWAGILRSVAQKHAPVRDVLGLPPGHELYGALMLGYPRVRLKYLPPRKPVRVTWR